GAAVGQVEEDEVRLLELTGRQQAEPRNDARPAPIGQLELQELDGQRVAGLRPVYVDRAGQRVDAVEVECEQVGRGRRAGDLAAGEVVGLDRDDVARLHRQHRLEPGIPPPVGGGIA